MTERPILFSGPMVRAILAGTKTQTRRAVKPSRGRPIEFLGGGPASGPDWNDPECWGYEHNDSGTWVLLQPDKTPQTAQYPCPYGQPGDRLWVRETWHAPAQFDNVRPRDIPLGTLIQYEAIGDGNDETTVVWGKGRPSMFMPRWASRIPLEVTDVRVERLQSISEADAIAEGYPGYGVDGTKWCARHWYQLLWNEIHGVGSWDANPWVWAVSFRRIDQVTV